MFVFSKQKNKYSKRDYFKFIPRFKKFLVRNSLIVNLSLSKLN